MVVKHIEMIRIKEWDGGYTEKWRARIRLEHGSEIEKVGTMTECWAFCKKYVKHLGRSE